ncbi:MAG: DUF1574 domain-containing protein [Cyanobacteria bacterium P01_F01_bin.116]
MFSHVKSDPPPTLDPTALLPWFEDVVNNAACVLKLKLRGNILHVYAQSAGLDRDYVLLRLVRSLLDRKDSLFKDFPQIYQLYFYSVRSEQQRPDWSTPIYLNRLERHLEQLVENSADLEEVKRSTAHLTSGIGYLDDATSAIVLSNASLARKGDPDAIARYLSQTLSSLDVGVDVVVKALPGKAKRAQGVVTATAGTITVDPSRDLINRLWILCRAAYSPDPAMVAEPTAQRLRDLKLTQFQDAVISVQVLGEATPDWRLRVDLTPDEEILKEWGRWGDTESTTRLLNQTLTPLNVSVMSEVKDTTLHLVCQPLGMGQTVVAEKGAHGAGAETDIIDAISPLLEQLAPQGLGRAMVYGPSLDGVNPAWLKCLDLPASEYRDLSAPTIELARQGDLPAIAYCLTKLLNPDLDEQLLTGGVRVQLLLRDQRLHIMIDAPVCPSRRQVAPKIKQYLRQNPIRGIAGVRIYGRRAGQKRPDWNYGYDRQAKQRLVPEAAPEFTASDAYLGDLIQPEDDDVAAVDSNLSSWAVEQVRSLLIKTQLFASVATDAETTRTMSPGRKAIALAWGALGLLLAFQADWIGGQLFKSQSLALKAQRTVLAESQDSAAEATPQPSTFEEQLAQLNWGRNSGDDTLSLDDDTLGAELPGFASSAINDTDLLGSPPQTTVSMTEVLTASPYPSFKSQQLNEKLALYDWYIAENGAPDVLVFGSSRALRGVDPAALTQALEPLGHENVSVFNFGVNGATAQIADLVVRQLLTNYPSPRLVLWADGARAFNSSRVDVTFNAIATSDGYQQLISGELFPDSSGEFSGPQLNPAQQINRYYARLDQQLSDTLADLSSAHGERTGLQKANRTTPVAANGAEAGAVNPTETDLIDAHGFLPLGIQFNPATYYLDHPRVAGTYDGDYKAFQMEGPQADALESLLDYTQARDITVAFINTPLTNEYLDPARMEVESRFQRYMLQIAAREPGLLYRDLGQLWPKRYDYFSDPSHLNRFGAYQLSNRLAQDPMIPWLKLKTPAE